MKQVFVNIAQFLVWVQQTVIALLRQIPGSEQVEAIAEGVTRPIRGLAAFFLRKFPWLKRWEWLLEIERLQKIHPVMLMVLLAFVFYRGLQTTYLGHIATDRMIYPFLGAISYFNPFLGILSAVTFGVGDLIQKLIYNDIYGSAATGGLAVLGAFGDGNYWGGVAGYCLAYSSIVVAGLLPGMLARVFRLAVRKTLALLFFRKAAATADGAKYGEPGKGPAGSTAGGAGAPAGGSQAGASGGMGSLMPGGTEPVYPMAEFLASILGAGVGGALTMGTLAPTLEKPAFYLRPNPDVSCHDMEVATYLKRPAFREGLSGPAIGGPLISGLMPLTGPVVEEAPPESDESPGPDDPRDGDGPEDAGPEDGPDDGGLFGEEPDVDWETTVEWDLAKDGPLTDPETGEELLVHDGNYEGGEPGQVWYKGEWMDAADAALLIHRWEEALERDRQPARAAGAAEFVHLDVPKVLQQRIGDRQP